MHERVKLEDINLLNLEDSNDAIKTKAEIQQIWITGNLGYKTLTKTYAICINDILLLHDDYVGLENLFLFIYYFDFDWIDMI